MAAAPTDRSWSMHLVAWFEFRRRGRRAGDAAGRGRPTHHSMAVVGVLIVGPDDRAAPRRTSVWAGRLTNGSIQERWLMKWIERAIRPAPISQMAPRGRNLPMPAGNKTFTTPAARPSRPLFRAGGARRAPGKCTSFRRWRAGRRGGSPCVCIWTAVLAGFLSVGTPSARAQGDRFPEGTIAKIEFEGNATITTDKIKPKLLSRVGQPLDQEKVEADLKTLMGTKWFSDVTPYYDETPPKSGKYTLTFEVREMPLLTKVEFIGRKAIRLKEIEDTTGLKKGNRADPTRTRLAIGQIQRLYQEKGYDLASVTLMEGGNPGDTKVVIEIFEGPKVSGRQHQLRGQRVRQRRDLADQDRHPEADPGTIRQVSPRHARRRPAEAHRVLPEARLFRGEGHPGDQADRRGARSTSRS